MALAGRYSLGTTKSPDYDVADAFVALCTAILHAENGCRPVLAPDPTWQERLVKEWEGAIWVRPSRRARRRRRLLRSIREEQAPRLRAIPADGRDFGQIP